MTVTQQQVQDWLICMGYTTHIPDKFKRTGHMDRSTPYLFKGPVRVRLGPRFITIEVLLKNPLVKEVGHRVFHSFFERIGGCSYKRATIEEGHLHGCGFQSIKELHKLTYGEMQL